MHQTGLHFPGGRGQIIRKTVSRGYDTHIWSLGGPRCLCSWSNSSGKGHFIEGSSQHYHWVSRNWLNPPEILIETIQTEEGIYSVGLALQAMCIPSTFKESIDTLTRFSESQDFGIFNYIPKNLWKLWGLIKLFWLINYVHHCILFHE